MLFILEGGLAVSDALYPPIEPYDSGMLDVGDGNRIHWEVCGNPRGKPALFVHGGPGWGVRPDRRRDLDPVRYRYILFHQRGCGRSTPHASDPSADMRFNTTEHLLADMERLRVHLGVDRWLLYGGSWGSTLMLAYAERHPERVTDMVIVGVTTTRPAEIDWLYRGLRRFLPEQWETFRSAVPDDDDVVAAYARQMQDPEVRAQTADAWCTWEDAVLATEPAAPAKVFLARSPADRIAVVRICAHYFANHAWLEDGVLLREAGRLAGIPGVLIHGRLDLSCPLDTAWELSKAWPDAELAVIDDSGHLAAAGMEHRIRRALDEFAS